MPQERALAAMSTGISSSLRPPSADRIRYLVPNR